MWVHQSNRCFAAQFELCHPEMRKTPKRGPVPLAEGEGFEPSETCASRHFECRALDRAMRPLQCAWRSVIALGIKRIRRSAGLETGGSLWLSDPPNSSLPRGREIVALFVHSPLRDSSANRCSALQFNPTEFRNCKAPSVMGLRSLRRGRDLNPRRLAPHGVSNTAHSTGLCDLSFERQ
jgi:hypothetical protein